MNWTISVSKPNSEVVLGLLQNMVYLGQGGCALRQECGHFFCRLRPLCVGGVCSRQKLLVSFFSGHGVPAPLRSRGRDNPDGVRVLMEDDQFSSWFLLHDKPVLWCEPGLSQPDLLFSGRLLAASQKDRLLCVFREFVVE